MGSLWSADNRGKVRFHLSAHWFSFQEDEHQLHGADSRDLSQPLTESFMVDDTRCCLTAAVSSEIVFAWVASTARAIPTSPDLPYGQSEVF